VSTSDWLELRAVRRILADALGTESHLVVFSLAVLVVLIAAFLLKRLNSRPNEQSPATVLDPPAPRSRKHGDTFGRSTVTLEAMARLATTFHRVVVLQGPGEEASGQIVPLTPLQPSWVIGRSSSSEGVLGLRDTALSRQHAIIELRDDTWYLKDLGSRNGCFVNGTRVAEVPLSHGAVLRMGESLLLFEALQLTDEVPLVPEAEPMWGPSIALQILRGSLNSAATHAVPMLLMGESGVGKEVAARYIHDLSGRSGPLVPVNCGALPPDLVEAELFGASAGAYTGAMQDRPGLFKAAEGGTLLLDEIGELRLDLQPKLLRVLADGEVRPVGATEGEIIDVRVVAATNRDLKAEVDAGRFRGDLLARLASWTLVIPPLRDRKEDILALARRVWSGAAPLQLSADTAEAMVLYPWPYNVRELRQVCDALAIQVPSGPIPLTALPDHLQESLQDRSPPPEEQTGGVPLALRIRRDRVPNVEELREVIEHYGGNMTQVARFFDKARFQVYRWCEKLEIDPKIYRTDETPEQD
jgi:DNA-binding NtrC family response regulator